VAIEIPDNVPVMILPEVSLFPGMMLPLFIFEPRYRQMLKEALEGDRLLAVAMRSPDDSGEVPEPVAGVGMIRASVENDDGTSHLILNGWSRVLVKRVSGYDPYPRIDVEPVVENDEPSMKAIALATKVKELAGDLIRRQAPKGGTGDDEAAYVSKMGSESFNQFADQLEAADSPHLISDMLPPALVADPRRKQELLATLDLEERLEKLLGLLMEFGNQSN